MVFCNPFLLRYVTIRAFFSLFVSVQKLKVFSGWICTDIVIALFTKLFFYFVNLLKEKNDCRRSPKFDEVCPVRDSVFNIEVIYYAEYYEKYWSSKGKIHQVHKAGVARAGSRAAIH